MQFKIKPLFILLSLLCIVSFVAACGGTPPPPPPAAEPTKVEPAAEPTKAEPAAEPTKVEPAAEPTKAEPAAEPTKAEPAAEPTKAEPAAEEIALPAVNPLEVTGNIVAAGSSTVFPLTERMAERFEKEGYTGQITIDSIGTGAGFERFCVTGESDISNASRAIKDTEVESCQKIGREPIEIRVGTDALAVVVSHDNDFAESLTLEELAMAFSTAETWADVNPDWPEEKILRYIPGTDSGTFDYFVEAVFEEDEAPILSGEPEMSEDDNVLVQGVQGSPYAIGFFGYAYYQENQETLRTVAIEGVEPTAEAVDSNEYPLARPLFIYTSAKIMAEKPQVGAFVNFYLTHVNEEIGPVGYFPANPAAINAAKQAWLDAHQ
jgi:phosphate transport system substrate-binding protein